MDADLSFVTTEDLTKELESRFDEMVFFGAMKSTSQSSDIIISFSGDYHCVLGLIELGRMGVQNGGMTDDE